MLARGTFKLRLLFSASYSRIVIVSPAQVAKMSLHVELKSMAKLVASDVKAGKESSRSHRAMEFMEINPDAILGVIDLIHREANRKKPNDALVHAYGYMFWSGLETLRYQVERQHDWAEELIDAVRELLLLLAKGDVISPELLMFLLNAFIEAKLDPGQDLSGFLAKNVAEHSEQIQASDPVELDDLLESIVTDAGGNEFDVYTNLAETSQTLPPEIRQAMMEQIVASANSVLRDTGVLYLLDPAPMVRRTVCQKIVQQASPTMLSSKSLRRMIALRNWLGEDERHHLDSAIKKARQKRVECATWPQRKINEVLASSMDGVGAQSVFAVAKEGRKHIIAGLLVKQGIGISDAWCIPDQSKADVKNFFEHIHNEMTSIPVEMDFLHALVGHFLAIGQQAGNTPTPGLLNFVETIGIENPQPTKMTADDLLSLLEEHADPSDIGEKAITKVIEGSTDWFDQSDFVTSWFEDDAEVREVLAEKPRSRKPTKINMIIKSILEPRREKWVERFLWTALWLRQEQDLLSPWLEFFVIGRELHNGFPVNDIPVMRRIAETTVISAMTSRF